MSRAFERLATVTVSTKRPPAVVGGKRGAPEPYLSGLKALSLMPVDAETRVRLGLGTPVETWQTFVEGEVDIREGDMLVVDGREYAVRAAAQWPGKRAYVWVIAEEVKR